MGAENFLTFQESDPDSTITRTSSRVTWTDMLAGAGSAYVYRDMGVNFFDSSFVQTLTINQTASERGGATVGCWAMSNDLDDFRGLMAGSKDAFVIQFSHAQSPDEVRLKLHELDGGVAYNDGSNGYVTTDGTVYYLKITRDETVGSYGEIKLQVYSNAARTTLLNTQQFNLHTSKKDFRYVMPCQSSDETAAITKKSSGYSEDLVLGETGGGAGQGGDVAPQVTQETPTSFGATTVTGNGHIVSEGLASVTEHGFCWVDKATYDVSGAPTTSDNKTTEGAGSVGAFTSSITGLTSGTIYYLLAYATNSFGTSYSNGFSFVAGASYSILSKGNLAVKVTQLHYVGDDGVEYWLQGTPV